MNESESYYVENVLYNGAVWTSSATQTLLKLYENKLGLLETPKKKKRIWLAIAESLKYYSIEMTADQVRWKINALTKKYKQCLDTGQHRKFKYFKEMEDIYTKYNVDCDQFAISECSKRRRCHKQLSVNDFNLPLQIQNESRAMIELRKTRLANRIESERTQSKLILEKQWLEYLKRQEHNRLLKDDLYNEVLKLREKELELQRHELQIKQSIELQMLELKEREQGNLLKIEKEKCEMLKQFFDSKDIV
ncbi:uncharacterized protein LOC112055337 isoform X2 [Bicyclus anynana]|uniref:Uncharacterized protein LOC112055337 isoform X2 n=1 Tax=Bicyclus anynana TaxID=110368 RepID=A0ABM3LF44_BICAN|nr:uncharacterized protein LOC112055337 isoform X2 [Bicyclus anynana]